MCVRVCVCMRVCVCVGAHICADASDPSNPQWPRRGGLCGDCEVDVHTLNIHMHTQLAVRLICLSVGIREDPLIYPTIV